MTLVAKRPHALEIVEGAHFGPKYVDDDIAAIDQHPVSCGQTLDPRRAETAVLDALGQLLGDRSDLPV